MAGGYIITSIVVLIVFTTIIHNACFFTFDITINNNIYNKKILIKKFTNIILAIYLILSLILFFNIIDISLEKYIYNFWYNTIKGNFLEIGDGLVESIIVLMFITIIWGIYVYKHMHKYPKKHILIQFIAGFLIIFTSITIFLIIKHDLDIKLIDNEAKIKNMSLR